MKKILYKFKNVLLLILIMCAAFFISLAERGKSRN